MSYKNFFTYFKKNKVVLIFLSLFILSAMLSYIGPVSGDGCWHISASKYIAKTNKIPFDEPLGRPTYFWPPFLFHLVATFFYKISDVIKLNTVFLILPLSYLGTLIFTYLIAKEDFNKKIAIFSVLFLGTTPLFLDYSSNYFIEVFLTFFVTGSIYFARKKKILLSGLFFGLALFSKLNGLFILPVLIYLIYKKKKLQLKPYLTFMLSSIIGLIPYIRNYVLLKNPIWPFLNSIFHGAIGPFADRGLSVDVNYIQALKTSILSFFGVPHGTLEYSLERIKSIINIDVSALIYFIFFIEIVIVAVVLVWGLKYKTKEKTTYFIWILFFIPLQIIYLFNIGSIFLRYYLPIYPVIAIFFGIGLYNIMLKYNKHKKIIFFSVLFLFSIFILTVSAKHVVAAISWNHFQPDFEFIKKNTAPDSLIYYAGQCLTTNTDRYSTTLPEDYSKINKNAIIFFNADYYIEPQSSLSEPEQNKIIETTKCTIIYSNKITGTKLCQVG